jgi:hypothetical protein
VVDSLSIQMNLAIVRFKMSFQIAQGVDPRAAPLAKRCALLGGPYRQLLEHGSEQQSHGVLRSLMTRHRATAMPLPERPVHRVGMAGVSSGGHCAKLLFKVP